MSVSPVLAHQAPLYKLSCLHPWQSIPSPIEGIVRLSVAKIVAYFSSPVARFFGGREKKIAIQLAGRPQGMPPAGERPCAKHIPFTGHAPGRALFLRSACPCAGHWPASGARTGRALQNGCAPCHWQSHCPALGSRAVAQAARPLAKRGTASGEATGEA